ncbi:TetR/AcrR family transcriptional regulator [Polymorphum gilvum]|uniref:Probable transcriptional regulator, TetR family n=1 Tax=Polymorphum gilvum (strain LMG 25793 / CGMCC 1.9160 / SL003B-26A1) TaxID=991905 RepID=F2J393_POLGS|nr:TetR/AcrR family transcriptional regulator [Polymorphum gilvum]ADZ69900.1 Probable transcriptional regulator, TetR family [Polymorphum gilvum SL003B-26A1]
MTDRTQKPRRRRRDARPGEIIEAAFREFAENGYAATRLDDVARRAGIAKGTIYRYFASKEALFEAVVRSRITPTLDRIEDLAAGFAGPTRELLRAVIADFYARIVDTDAKVLIRIMIAEGNRFPDITGFYYRETISKGIAILTRIVERGIARGEVRAGAAADLPFVILGPGLLAAIWKLTFDVHAPIALERFLEAHVDLVLNGFLVSDAREARPE